MTAWDAVFADPRVRGPVEQERAAHVEVDPEWEQSPPTPTVDEIRARIKEALDSGAPIQDVAAAGDEAGVIIGGRYFVREEDQA